MHIQYRLGPSADVDLWIGKRGIWIMVKWYLVRVGSNYELSSVQVAIYKERYTDRQHEKAFKVNPSGSDCGYIGCWYRNLLTKLQTHINASEVASLSGPADNQLTDACLCRKPPFIICTGRTAPPPPLSYLRENKHHMDSTHNSIIFKTWAQIKV